MFPRVIPISLMRVALAQLMAMLEEPETNDWAEEKELKTASGILPKLQRKSHEKEELKCRKQENDVSKSLTILCSSTRKFENSNLLLMERLISAFITGNSIFKHS